MSTLSWDAHSTTKIHWLTFVTTTTIGRPRLSESIFSSRGRRTRSSSFIPDLLLSSFASSGSTYSWNCRTTEINKRKLHGNLLHFKRTVFSVREFKVSKWNMHRPVCYYSFEIRLLRFKTWCFHNKLCKYGALCILPHLSLNKSGVSASFSKFLSLLCSIHNSKTIYSMCKILHTHHTECFKIVTNFILVIMVNEQITKLAIIFFMQNKKDINHLIIIVIIIIPWYSRFILSSHIWR